MSFFQRNRAELEKRGVDPARLPPGQYHTDRFPVLHAGPVPDVDLATWDLRVFGLVEAERRFTWDEFLALPAVEVTADIHCVTKWSKFDTTWRGVRFRDVFDLAGLQPGAAFVVQHAEHGFTVNTPLPDLLVDTSILAYQFAGEALTPEHGYPLRGVVPHLYFWKGAKWVRGLEVADRDMPGFWERNGYHMYGDPFKEQRFWGD